MKSISLSLVPYSSGEFKARVATTVVSVALLAAAVALAILAGPIWGCAAFFLIGVIALSMGIREIVVYFKDSPQDKSKLENVIQSNTPHLQQRIKELNLVIEILNRATSPLNRERTGRIEKLNTALDAALREFNETKSVSAWEST